MGVVGVCTAIPLPVLMDELQAVDGVHSNVAHVKILSGGLSDGAKFIKLVAIETP